MEETTTIAPEEQLGWTRPNVRTVDRDDLDLVLTKIAKVNRKAEKLGAAPFTFEVSEPRLVELMNPETGRPHHPKRFKQVVDITIHGAPVQVGGYRFLGRIDFEDGMVLVNARPGEEIPPRYRSATTYCDHCASQRRRNAVFVFRRDGDSQHVQVGRTCLQDFMGHEPAQVLWSASLWTELCDELEDGFGGGRASYMYQVDSVLQMAAAVVRVKGGFISRQQERDSDGTQESTASLVMGQLDPPRAHPRGWAHIYPPHQDIDRAAEAKAWALASMTKPEQSDYEYNLTTLLQANAVVTKRVGMVASLIGVYARHLGEVVAREKRVNAHVGQVGQRRKFIATFAGVSIFDTSYGTMFIGRFDTPEGQLIYKGSSPFWPRNITPGDTINMTATIKKHDEYKGFRQTHIQRAALLERRAAA